MINQCRTNWTVEYFSHPCSIPEEAIMIFRQWNDLTEIATTAKPSCYNPSSVFISAMDFRYQCQCRLCCFPNQLTVQRVSLLFGTAEKPIHIHRTPIMFYRDVEFQFRQLQNTTHTHAMQNQKTCMVKMTETTWNRSARICFCLIKFSLEPVVRCFSSWQSIPSTLFVSICFILHDFIQMAIKQKWAQKQPFRHWHERIQFASYLPTFCGS